MIRLDEELANGEDTSRRQIIETSECQATEFGEQRFGDGLPQCLAGSDQLKMKSVGGQLVEKWTAPTMGDEREVSDPLAQENQVMSRIAAD